MPPPATLVLLTPLSGRIGHTQEVVPLVCGAETINFAQHLLLYARKIRKETKTSTETHGILRP